MISHKLMSCIVDKRIEDNHTREEYGSVRNFKSLLKKYLPLKFPIYDPKRF